MKNVLKELLRAIHENTKLSSGSDHHNRSQSVKTLAESFNMLAFDPNDTRKACDEFEKEIEK
jgi:hypothetical protein